jgi:uncharacterized protein
MQLDDTLLRILACPIDKKALLHFPDDDVLYNPRLRRRYPVDSGIPVLLADHAEAISVETHDELVRRAASGAAHATLGFRAHDLVEPGEVVG